VRDPVRRVVDIFRKNFASQGGAEAKPAFDESGGLSAGNATKKLNEFAEAFSDEQSNAAGAQPHLESYAKLCSPCHLRYDFIGRVETMSDDVKYVFMKTDVRNIEYEIKEDSVRREKVVEDLRGKLSTKNFKSIAEKLSLDFSLFGYRQS